MLGAPPLAHLPAGDPSALAAGRVRRGHLRLRRLFGEVAMSLILGGTGYQLLGNEIASALDVLNYPLAAAISTRRDRPDAGAAVVWYLLFDVGCSSARSWAAPMPRRARLARGTILISAGLAWCSCSTRHWCRRWLHSFADTTAGGAGPFRTTLPSSTMRACCARFRLAPRGRARGPDRAAAGAARGEAVRVCRCRASSSRSCSCRCSCRASDGPATALVFQILGISRRCSRS